MLPPSVLTTNLGRYRRNIQILRSHLDPGTRFCAVVKANGYGHGLAPVALAAQEAGADALGIVDNREAMVLREAGISLPVYRLRSALPEEVEEVLDLAVEEVVGDLRTLKAFSDLVTRRGTRLAVHLKVDVGIGRMGISPSNAEELIRAARDMPGIRIGGLMTHFPNADDPEAEVTLTQIKHFQSVLTQLHPLLPKDVIIHASNSAAMIRFPESRFNMVRIGLASYGLSPSRDIKLPSGISPVLRWTTKLAQIRPMKRGETVGYGMTCQLDRDSLVGTLPIGYADGYFRALSGPAEVFVRGRRCRTLGIVSMDMICVDLTDIPGVTVGDEVELLGDHISANELAELAGTISYEILTRVGNTNRAGRDYV